MGGDQVFDQICDQMFDQVFDQVFLPFFFVLLAVILVPELFKKLRETPGNNFHQVSSKSDWFTPKFLIKKLLSKK